MAGIRSAPWPPRWMTPRPSRGEGAAAKAPPFPAPQPPPEHAEACNARRGGHGLVKRLSAALRPSAKSTPVEALPKAAAGDSHSYPLAGEYTPGRPPRLVGSPCERCGCGCASGASLLHDESTASLHSLTSTGCGSTPCMSAAYGSRASPCCGQHCAEYTPSCSSRTCAAFSRSSASTPRTARDPFFAGSPARSEGLGSREVFSLYASPLDQPPINVRSEVETMRDALLESGSRARLNVGVATASSLTKLLTLARTRKGLVLHLSAHAIVTASGELGLVLEDAKGASHVLWRHELEELLGIRERGLRHVSLLFLSTCWSQELAQVFVECGCRHVIALRTRVNDSAARRFSQQFYLTLGVGESLLLAWEGARRALAVDADRGFAKQAEHFVLFGQHGAEQATLDTLSGAGECLQDMGPLIRDMEDASTFLEMKLPPRTEHFLGRTQAMLEILHTLGGINGRRACVVHGPEGIGKSALGVELAHFASAPGRAFSCAARVLRLESLSLLDVLCAVEEELEGLAAQLRVPMRPSSGDSRSSVASTPRSEPSNSSLHSARSTGDLDALAFLLPMRQRIRRGFQHLERARRGQRWLLVVDDEAGAVSRSPEVSRLLGELLENTNQLQVIICSRDPIYRSLGSTKVVNLPLRGLSEVDSAKLLLQRIHRPLSARDFPQPLQQPPGCNHEAGSPHGARPSVDVAARQLCGHPLLARLAGHPGRLRQLGNDVVPGGPSLTELAVAEGLPELPEPVAGLNVAVPIMGPGGRPLGR